MAPKRSGHSLSKQPGVTNTSAMAHSGGDPRPSKPQTKSKLLEDRYSLEETGEKSYPRNPTKTQIFSKCASCESLEFIAFHLGII